MQEISNHVAASYTFILVVVQIVTLIAQLNSYTRGTGAELRGFFAEFKHRVSPDTLS